jgi:hypothetical protein
VDFVPDRAMERIQFRRSWSALFHDANAHVVNGRLLVYDAVHLAADGSLKVLWDSQRWGVQFLFNKFDPPVTGGGQIYLPNYNGGVDLYRLVR